MAASRVADNASISGDANVADNASVADSAGIAGATSVEAIARPPDYRRMMR